MYRSIMVRLDGSSFSEQALPFARSIAHEAGAYLDLVHVHTRPMPLYAIDVMPMVDAEDGRRRAEEHAYLKGLVQSLRGAAAQASVATLLDEPIVPALKEHTIAMNIDLVVMTTHGRGALSRFWLGSITDLLVHQLSIPLLLIRPQEAHAAAPRDSAFTNILIPLDGSELAEDILDHALALGAPTNAHYTLVQAIDPILHPYFVPPVALPVDEQQVWQVRIDAQTYLDQIAERLRAHDLVVETEIVIGAPAHVILAYAQQHNIDLIAMSIHGHGGFKRLFLGSVADKVVRGACVPVLIHRARYKVGDRRNERGSEPHETTHSRMP